MARAGLLLALVGCDVVLDDLTESSFVFAPPINDQTVRVRVSTAREFVRVELQTPLASEPMLQEGTGDWVATLPQPVCVGAASYWVSVTTRGPLGGESSVRFPETGSYSRPIGTLPLRCASFEEPVVRTFVVLRVEDFPDNDPGDGRCEGTAPDDTVACSLRAAVMEANALPGLDAVELSSLRHRLTVAGLDAAEPDAGVGDLDVTDSLVIRGAGPRELSMFDFLQGVPPTPLADDEGADTVIPKIDAGGLGDRVFHVTGANTVLRLEDVAVLGGSTTDAGGAVHNEATTVLERVAFLGNTASTGGGVYNRGVLAGHDVAFVYGAADDGAGVANEGVVALDRVLFAQLEGRRGLAVHNRGFGALEVRNATVARNGESDPPDTLFDTAGASTRMDLSYVTVAFQAVTDTGAALTNSVDDPSPFTLHSSLFGENAGPTCAGPISSFGGNVMQRDCVLGGTPRAVDAVGVGLVGTLGSLGAHGGYLATVHLTPPPTDEWFDPRDRGLGFDVPLHDARGEPRPVDADGDGVTGPDAGAYEYAP